MKPIKEKKTKRKYNVYWVGEGQGCYTKNYCNEYVGSTIAVSEAQACNNVRNRLKGRGPNGGYSTDILGDACDQGCVFFSFKASLAE